MVRDKREPYDQIAADGFSSDAQAWFAAGAVLVIIGLALFGLFSAL